MIIVANHYASHSSTFLYFPGLSIDYRAGHTSGNMDTLNNPRAAPGSCPASRLNSNYFAVYAPGKTPPDEALESALTDGAEILSVLLTFCQARR
jgi:hypothetical protein